MPLKFIRHFLLFSAKQFRIGYGHVKAREVIRLKAQSALIHSDFDAQTLENDLAIITLPQNQLINLQIVRPIAITKTPVKVTDEGIVASFGFENNESTTISENLMIGHQIVIENEACAAAFDRPVHVNQFCGQDPKAVSPPGPPEGSSEPDDSKLESDEKKKNSDGFEDEPVADNDDDDWTNGWSRSGLSRVATDEKNQTSICRGDTGSALVRETDKGTVGYGIVSRVPQGCNVDKPALYTHLPAFYQWLEDATLGEVHIVDF